MRSSAEVGLCIGAPPLGGSTQTDLSTRAHDCVVILSPVISNPKVRSTSWT